MGLLTDFDLRHLITDFGCRVLIETGIGKGLGTDEAAGLDFLQIFAIEPKHALALPVAIRHAANHKVTVIHARIERGLDEAFAEILPGQPALFWMNGHQPGADGRPRLEQQLRLIAARRQIAGDVFLINDWRIYEDGAYDEGPVPEQQRALPDLRRIDFIEEILAATHELQRSRRRTGYLCAYPMMKA